MTLFSYQTGKLQFKLIFSRSAESRICGGCWQQANAPTGQQQPAGVLGARSPSITPSRLAVPSGPGNGPSRGTKEDIQAGDSLVQLGSPVQPGSGTLPSEEDARNLQTLSAALESGGEGFGDKRQTSSGKLSAAPKIDEAVEEPVGVAERIRRRFHSQKLFQEDEEGDNGSGLDPLPNAVVEEMLKEAQQESTNTNSATKVVCLSNCSMHAILAQSNLSKRALLEKQLGSRVCVLSESENYESETGECPNDCSGNGLSVFTRLHPGVLRLLNGDLPEWLQGSQLSTAPKALDKVQGVGRFGCVFLAFGCSSDADCSKRGSCEAGVFNELFFHD
ncbi:hypothetical protein ACSSS7_001915 [Eimeria intestinalis]